MESGIAARTAKAQRTRDHILHTALGLFAQRSYQSTTMRDIAGAAGCSLGLAYRYFRSKEELVIAVYEDCSDTLAKDAVALTEITIAKRFAAVVRASFAHLSPYRDSIGAISGVALNPHSEAGVLSDRMANLRRKTWIVFLVVASGARDAPQTRDVEHLTTLLYAAYLLLMLFWVHDRSEQQKSTGRLLDFGEDALSRLRPLLNIPILAKSLGTLAEILAPMFAGAPQVDAT